MTIRSADLAHHISAINTARKAFITSEVPEKIKVALKENIRNYFIRKDFMSWEIKFITNEAHLHNGKVQLKFWVKMNLYYSLDMVQDISKPISAEYN